MLSLYSLAMLQSLKIFRCIGPFRALLSMLVWSICMVVLMLSVSFRTSSVPKNWFARKLLYRGLTARSSSTLGQIRTLSGTAFSRFYSCCCCRVPILIRKKSLTFYRWWTYVTDSKTMMTNNCKKALDASSVSSYTKARW